jgi:uncharacterized protein YndB with AHSA1/START domain
LHVQEGGVVEQAVRREIVLPADPDEVWAALTEPERLEEWFATEVDLDPRPGGEGRFRWGNGEERRAVVDVVEPGRRIAFRWSGDDERVSCVGIMLEPVPEGTRVEIVESPSAGWSAALELRALAPFALV